MNLCIIGASGRMGKLVAAHALESKDLKIVGAVESEASSNIGQDIGLFCGMNSIGVIIESNMLNASKNADVIIDFSGANGTEGNIESYKSLNIPMVIGSTGLKSSAVESLKALSKNIPIVFSPNMSMGVNVLFKLTEIVAKVLESDFDIEIIESHHNKKKDAPSGTAMKLAEIITSTLNLDLEKDVVYGRSGLTGERKKKEIGIHAVRGGDIVGEHIVMFCGNGEIIELTHKATSRSTFAMGALKASKWVYNKKPGLYSMFDVLGLK
jgi:4-hydroxy-tetrahydrodipicolinate reductase